MEIPGLLLRIALVPATIAILAVSSCVSIDDSYMQGAGLKVPAPGPRKKRPWEEKKDHWVMPFPKPAFLDSWEETWNDW